MKGTLLNMATVVLGTGLGVALGTRISERLRRVAFTALGLTTSLIGVQMAFKTEQVLVPMLSLLLGGLLGEALRIDERLAAVGRRFSGGGHSLSEGFLSASLLFCVGAMTVLGAIEEGLSGTFKIYAAKATLDGVAATAFATTLGWGVGLSALTILVVQGGLTLAAGLMQPLLTPPVLAELTATGGLMLVSLGLGLLEIKRLPVAAFLPALMLAPFLAIAARHLPL